MATSSLSARLSARLASPEASFVVMGASRGIGLAMVKDLLARSRGSVFAASRNALQSPHLTDLAAKHPSRLIPVQCDMLDPSSIAAMAKSVAACHTRLDCLINVAGVLHEGALKPEKSLAAVKEESMITVLRTNAVGPVLVAQTLQPLLGDGSVVANVSARVGSIGDNGLGGWWSYRMSKAALNMATKNLAIEIKRVGAIAVSLHPGTTNTDLSKPFQRNVRPEKLFSSEFTASSLLNVISSLTLDDTGGFFAYDRTRIEW